MTLILLHCLKSSNRQVLGLAVAGVMVSATTLIADYYSGPARAAFMGLQAGFMGLGGVVFLTLGAAEQALPVRNLSVCLVNRAADWRIYFRTRFETQSGSGAKSCCRIRAC
jgi:MFS family permease